jgi:hypothetical protein
MQIDLAKLYAKVKQRAERDRGTNCENLGEAARTLAKEIMFTQTLAATRRFAKAERAWLQARWLYAVWCGTPRPHLAAAGTNGLAGRCLSLDIRR